MKLPAGRVILSIASASAVWFGIITFLAFRAGDNWDLLQSYLVRSGKLAGGIAVAIVALVIGIWLWKRRHRKDE
jgi:membrane protein DedA with SNARE-associated domain